MTQRLRKYVTFPCYNGFIRSRGIFYKIGEIIMKKMLFNTSALLVRLCFFTLFFSGCNANKSSTLATPPNNEIETPDSITPSQTAPPNNETPTPDSITPSQTASPTETSTPHIDSQVPGSASRNQIHPSESAPVTALETGLEDGTEVKLIVSGQELENHRAVIIGGEALISDHSYIFGSLKDAGGIENAGFWTGFSVDTALNRESAFIENSQYSVKIVEGEYSFICNDKTIPLTVPAQKINGQFMVPLKAIAEAINANVEWDEATQTISFFYIDPSESASVTALETDLDDSAKVKPTLLLNEMRNHNPISFYY